MVWEIVIAGIILFVLFVLGKFALAAAAEFLNEADDLGQLLRVVGVIAGVIILASAMAYFAAWDNPRPYILTRSTAAYAIESTAQFQHGTKVYFDIDEVEGVVSDVCHSFRFSSDKAAVWNEYRKAGVLKFSPWGDPSESKPAPGPASWGSMDMSLDGIYLTDHIERCTPHAPEADIGRYELAIGRPVVEVNGIQENGSHATVDFIWYFQSLNEIGQSLAQIKGRKESIQYEKNLSGEEKAKAPFWNGSAEMLKFDDGWRVVAIKGLSPDDPIMGSSWTYGPEVWPDPDFNWGAFDEDENHW